MIRLSARGCGAARAFVQDGSNWIGLEAIEAEAGRVGLSGRHDINR